MDKKTTHPKETNFSKTFRLTWIANFVRAYHGATTPTRQSTTLENPSTILYALVPSRYEYTSFFAQPATLR